MVTYNDIRKMEKDICEQDKIKLKFIEFCDKYIEIKEGAWISKWALTLWYDEICLDRYSMVDFMTNFRLKYSVVSGKRNLNGVDFTTFEGVCWKDENLIRDFYRTVENFVINKVSSDSEIMCSTNEFYQENDERVPYNLDEYYEKYEIFCKSSGFSFIKDKKDFIKKFESYPRH